MSLKNLRHLQKRIGVRLWVSYSFVFILISAFLLLLTHMFLGSQMRNRDRENVETKANQLSDFYVHHAEALKPEIAREDLLPLKDSFFIRIANQNNKTLYASNSSLYSKFHPEVLEKSFPSKEWIRILEVGESQESGDALEILSRRLPDGALLQVGKSTEYRQDFLETFDWIYLAVMVPIFLSGGVFLSFRTLRPLRTMLATMKSIREGNMESRLPLTSRNDELNELGKLFNSMLERIEGLIRGMRNSLDNVAHDLRTPITRLRVTAESALQSDPDVETYREALADCLDETDTILATLDTLMDISEAETGSMRLHFEDVAVRDLLENTIDLYQHVADEKGLQINLRCAENLCVHADRSRMRQVLANLVDNAIKYTDSGHITLESFSKDSEIIIQVCDTGIGMSKEDLPRVWERLYRSDQSRSQRGIGLGLSLVRAVVIAHNGRVDASSEIGNGSTFRIHLPAAEC